MLEVGARAPAAPCTCSGSRGAARPLPCCTLRLPLLCCDQEKIAAARADRATRERAQQQLLRSIEREVHEQQIASVAALHRQLEQLDRADADFDLKKGEEYLHRLNRAAGPARRSRAGRGDRW